MRLVLLICSIVGLSTAVQAHPEFGGAYWLVRSFNDHNPEKFEDMLVDRPIKFFEVGGKRGHKFIQRDDLSEELKGCTISLWSDFGSSMGHPFISWDCPTRISKRNSCRHVSYRSDLEVENEEFVLRWLVKTSHKDISKCGGRPGIIAPAPPRPYKRGGTDG